MDVAYHGHEREDEMHPQFIKDHPLTKPIVAEYIFMKEEPTKAKDGKDRKYTINQRMDIDARIRIVYESKKEDR